MWTPVLVSFFKLLEVGFLPTWVLFPFLSVFPCFGWFEAVRGRLIGPKTWDRIVRNYLGFSVLAVTAQKNLEGCWVFLFHQNGFKSCVCMENAGNGLLIGPKTWDRNCGIVLEY